MQDILVTTSYHPTSEQKQKAQQLANKFQIPYLPREDNTLKTFWQYSKNLLIVQTEKIILQNKEKEFFFHPNMAKLRITNIQQGRPDHLLNSLALEKGDSVLDCTLGLAGDAITISYLVGEKGEIVGLETSPLIYELTSYGLNNTISNNYDLNAAMRRIIALQEDYNSYLKNLPDKSFDVVYFDPMFDKTVVGSNSMSALRSFAEKSILSAESLEQAKRVACKRVVLKTRRGSNELVRLRFPHKAGGKYSHIHYGYFLLS